MQTYTFNNQSIKIQHINNQAWFCGADVARAIGYKNPAEAIADNVSPKNSRALDLGKKGRKPIFISEAGLFELIMRSTLPAAAQFQDWAHEQVFPSILRTGTYTGQMPLTELGSLMSDLPALITKENLAPPKRTFKVRDLVVVDYGGGDRREAIIIDFLDRYIYVKFLDSGKPDFVAASQLSKIEAHQ